MPLFSRIPLRRRGGGSVGTYSNRSPSTCVLLRESIAATCSTWQADGYLSHEGFQWAWLCTHIVNFVFINVNLLPTPSWDRDGFISKIRACLNAVKSSPGCPHCSSSSWVKHVLYTMHCLDISIMLHVHAFHSLFLPLNSTFFACFPLMLHKTPPVRNQVTNL